LATDWYTVELYVGYRKSSLNPDSPQPVPEDEQQFRTLADSMAQLAWMAHPDGYIFWYNRRWYEYTGTTPEQMQGWGWQSVHDPAELPRVLEGWRAAISNGSPFEMEFPLLGADGTFRSFLTRVMPVRDGAGKILRWFGTNTDVDELRRAQNALRESERRLRISEERLRLTQRVAKIGSWELDLDRDQYVWSDEAFEMFGIRPGSFSLTQKNFLSLLFVSSDREAAEQALKRATTRNKEYFAEFRIARPDGTVRWISARGKQFYNLGHSLMLGVFIDVTDAHQGASAPETDNKRSPQKLAPVSIKKTSNRSRARQRKIVER